jgi:UPF0716 protein FxsA
MLSRIKVWLLLTVVLDLVLLGVMVHYTSWLFMLGFVFVSALVGGWLLNNGLRYYAIKTGNSAKDSSISGEGFLLGAAARLAAGVLFILPGVMTDLMALLLISPAGKLMVKIMLSSFFGGVFPSFSNQNHFSRSTDDRPAKDEIIDVRIISDGDKDPENQR